MTQSAEDVATPKPSIGRLVHYTLPDGQCRPAIVVQDWGGNAGGFTVNLVVFVDGGNDERGADGEFLMPGASTENLVHWKTSVPYSENQPHHWHWPERV